jgi:hypothetical protein
MLVAGAGPAGLVLATWLAWLRTGDFVTNGARIQGLRP